MRLHHSPSSPFVRKVMLLLHETGQVADVEILPTQAAPLGETGYPYAVNPLGKVPALDRTEGPALYDSRVICRYLDHRAGAGLYPEPPRLWDTLTLEATGDGICEAAVLMVYEARMRPEAARSEAWVEAQWGKVARALDALEARWLSHLAGKLDMGQIAIGAALGYLDLRHGARDWRAGREGLARWYADFAERPSMQATRPPEA